MLQTGIIIYWDMKKNLGIVLDSKSTKEEKINYFFNRQSFKSGAISQIEEGAAVAFDSIKRERGSLIIKDATLISHEGSVAYYDPCTFKGWIIPKNDPRVTLRFSAKRIDDKLKGYFLKGMRVFYQFDIQNQRIYAVNVSFSLDDLKQRNFKIEQM